MSAAGAPPALSPAHLADLCGLLYRRTGMVYGETKRAAVERRVAERMARAGTASPAAYLQLLRGSAAEAERFINSFTVNETSFYREAHQFACLSGALLPAIVANRAPGERVRLWSVPCATGEEPYSIALWLLENWPLVDAYHVEIVGSDIDTDALARAAEGFYGARAVARLPPAVRRDYFAPNPDGTHRLIADLRESVTLTQANLIDAASMRAHGTFDVIFCRNVLIYFDEPARQVAARHLHAALNPGGFLCLGHTEFMDRISPHFVPRRFAEAVVYQRRD